IPTASFFTEGITITHSARSSTDLGILSGISRISLRTVPASCKRSRSFSCAQARAQASRGITATENLFIKSPLRLKQGSILRDKVFPKRRFAKCRKCTFDVHPAMPRRRLFIHGALVLDDPECFENLARADRLL